MKPSKKIIVLLMGFILFACSENSETNQPNETDQSVEKDHLVKYVAVPEMSNQLLAATYIQEDDATTFMYGSVDENGEVLSLESLVYRATNSNEVYYLLLDNFQRVTQIYSEVNGVKNDEVQYFHYAEPGLVNYILAERNWATQEEKIVHFSTIEIDGENYNNNILIGKTSKVKKSFETMGPFWDALVSNLIVAGTVAAAAITLVIVAKGVSVISALTAAVLFTGAVFASETPIENINSNAPVPPKEDLVGNTCVNSNFNVIIGVDPGNVLTAIVTNGNSSSYTFYWSTGDKATTLIGHTITAPDDKTYYVLVVDENGCTAFASSHPYVKPLAWYKGTYTLTPFRTDVTDYSECGTQFDEIGQFYVYLAEVQGKKEAIVYSKSIIEGMPHVYSHASYVTDGIYITQFSKDDAISPRQWREVIGTDPKTGFDIPRVFRMSQLRVNEADNSLIASPGWSGDVGLTLRGVQTNDANMNCAAYGSNATSNQVLLYSYDFVYYLKDVSASYFGLYPPDEITAFDVTNMEFILAHKNEGVYHIVVDN